MTCWSKVLTFTALTTGALAITLPYNPTRLFLPSDSALVYIVDTTSQNSTSLLALNISQTINTKNISLQTLTNASTFPIDTQKYALNVVQDTAGDLVVLSGNCTQGASTSQAWRYSTEVEQSTSKSSWQQSEVTGQQSINYLSDGLAFGGQSNGSISSIYLFGGMCSDGDATNSTWTEDATYSADMLQLVQNSITNDTAFYTESVTLDSDGPVAEAGFSVTTLPATSTTGSLQQHYIFLGGHTQTAFINMSQAALFSLPQESWTFLSLQQPNSTQIDPRSGHTSILTSDGSKIVLFGGWVGDVNTAAQPQLAVLDIGSGYGGQGQWQWTTPSTSGNELATDAGIFGHGATMLPGNIMLVYGGYSISSSSTSTKRADSATSSQTLLFNVSSNQWISSYTIPASTTTSTTTHSSDTSKEKIALAVGLTVGFLILIALIAFYFWYTRRVKRQREADRNLMSRSSDGSYNHISEPFLEKNSIDGRGGDLSSLGPAWLRASDTNQSMEQKSAATGSFMDVPSPTRGLRKGLASRNHQYHAAPRYDEKRGSRHSGNIHPIAEIEDEDASSVRAASQNDRLLSEAQRQLKEVEKILQGNRHPERFQTALNPLHSHPVLQESQNAPRLSQTITPNWAVERDDEPGISGRISPTKTDERTSSTLSDRSHRSFFSDNSITRTMSTRTGTLLAAAAAAHVRAKAVEAEASSSSDGRTETMSTTGRTSPVSRRGIARSSTSGSSGAQSAGVYAESYRTARSHAASLHNEGTSLLDEVQALDHDDPYRRAQVAGPSSMPYGTRRRQGILGSLRKAIGAISAGDRTMSLSSNRGYTDHPSTNSSPTKERRSQQNAPRRAVSDGAALLRQKRGQHDWADAAWPPYRDDPDPGDWGEPTRTSTEKQQAEEDWDVEDAAAKRDVQIMFTVPKSRLRVVNADMDRASLRSVSDGALSRGNSIRALRHEDSRNALRVRDGAEREKLDTMPEVEIDDKDKGA